MPGLEGVKAELRGLESRVDGIHNGLGSVRGKQAKQEVQSSVLRTELKGVSEDIGELKMQMKWVLRGLWLAAATFTTFTVSLAVLIVSVLR